MTAATGSAATGSAGNGSGTEPLAEARPRKLLGLSAGELGLRFVFGAAASVVAGLVSLWFGARLGGVPLALPAILIASITLEQRKGGREAVEKEVAGAPLGAVGMVAFAATVVALLRRMPLAAVLALATAAWFATAVAAYLVVQAFHRNREG